MRNKEVKMGVQFSMVGMYGDWIKETIESYPKEFSFLNYRWRNLSEWKREARKKFFEYVVSPLTKAITTVNVKRRYNFDGLSIEELEWQLSFGPPTEAVFIKPDGEKGMLPGVLALHDHGGNKYFGKSKIISISNQQHPFLSEYQKVYYGGRSWACQLARRGYGVLVHDIFPFESRKIIASELPGFVVKRMMSHPEEIEEVRPEDIKGIETVTDYDVISESTGKIKKYNAFAGQHETLIAKSLVSAGLVWPGVYLLEDRAALDYLCSREDIDSSRIGCGGLSGGGMRTNCLAAVDDRIKCSVTAGFMTTWQDFALHTCYTHTWMIYIPILPRFMDYPDILSMRAPLPTMVLSTLDDPLFTLVEVKKAETLIKGVFDKAGAGENFVMNYYEGAHKFDIPMQEDAFSWFDRFLR
ncbi:MAG: hypothetical protein DRP87_07815 [Spirochaetes bacterium]|nr:MAG: hypothetical protein DRP87_07815 [Spirochaetota bacterium]